MRKYFWPRLLLLLLLTLFFYSLEKRLMVFLLAYILLSALIFFLLPRYFTERVLFWGQKGLDFLTIFFLVKGTGGRESPLFFLFFLPPLETALWKESTEADIVALLSLLFLGYFFFVEKPPSRLLKEWFAFFIYVGALGLISILALKLSELRAEILHQTTLQRILLTSLSAGLIFLDRDLHILSWNPQAEKIFSELKKGEFLPKMIGQGLPLRHSEGEIQVGDRLLGYSLFPLRKGDQAVGWGFLFQDITEARRQEEALAEARRLASLGTMAAGLIHEIRNPLATLSGGVEFLREHLGEVEDLAPVLEMMGREIERLNRLITHFLFFARPERGEIEEFEVRELLEEIFHALKEEFSGLEVLQKIDLGKVRANRDQWRQILENLLANAAQATREAGRTRVRIEISAQGDYYVFKVEDTGPGIPPEVRPKIFDPFFTTKAQGTGLGLAVVYRIVKNLGGEILVFSEKDKGSLFEIRLPKTSESINPGKA